MALKQKFTFLIVFAISIFSCFCFDFGSGQNPFDVSSLLFDKEGAFVISQTINCTEDRIEINYVVKNSTDLEMIVPAKFECAPLGDQRSANDIAIPYGFKILINGKDAKFTVYNGYAQIKNYYENNSYDKKSEIHFNMTIPSKEKIVVKVSYQNLQNAGTNQTGTNFKYLIKLQKNKNNEPIDYDFSYTSSKDSEAYIENIIIFDGNDDIYPELNYNIERSFSAGNVWSFNIVGHAFESDNMYVFMGLTYYDLSADSTDIRIYSHNNTRTIYFKDRNLTQEPIEQKELFFLSNEQLRLLRNAFYAIHGYHFKSHGLQNYFTKFMWYKVNPNFSESDFNETERKNIALIRKMENMKTPLSFSDYLNGGTHEKNEKNAQ
ncbi:MAG: YARHG domain-containing protein [Treponemataceae bacterium]|nr:YARHG domain-containing protein [Treponemataceae bacterium]